MVRPPYQVAIRLCDIAVARWAELDAAYYQVDLLSLRPYRLLNLVYTWCIERVPQDRLESWLEELHDLLPWQDSDSAAAEQVESESFMNMMNQSKARVRTN